MKNNMLIDNAYKVFINARAGNGVSAACFNDWAVNNKMPTVDSHEYDLIMTYDDFYDICNFYIFGD